MKLEGTTFTIDVIMDDNSIEKVSYDLLNIEECLDCVDVLTNTITELVDRIESMERESYIRASN